MKTYKGESRSKLRAMYKEHKAKEDHLYPSHDAVKFREHILSMSLFPNLYNKEYLEEHL